MTNTKKKKGNKMKLLSAVGMLTVSAAMLVSSTFAWFSLNKDVHVQTLSLTAKSNQTFLLISKTNTTAGTIQTEGATTATESITGDDAKVYPSSPALTSAEAAYLTVAEGHKKVDDTAISTAGVLVNDADKAATVTNWFTANAAAVNAATIQTASAKQLTSFDGYVIHKTYYLTVAAGSNPANNLKVTAAITQSGNGADAQAIKLLVTTDDGGFANLYTAGNDGTAHGANLANVDIKGTNTSITSSTVRQVDVYLYYDGDEAPVYTNNAANLTGADVDLTFTVDPVE
jgi:hypothetical protein